MKIHAGIITALCLLLAASMQAQKIEGKDAPDFTMGGTVNCVGDVDKSSLMGEVIVIKVWGIT